MGKTAKTAVSSYWSAIRPANEQASSTRTPVRPRRFDQPISASNPVIATKLA